MKDELVADFLINIFVLGADDSQLRNLLDKEKGVIYSVNNILKKSLLNNNYKDYMISWNSIYDDPGYIEIFLYNQKTGESRRASFNTDELKK